MATKSYTDLEQSKILAKILSLESADMSYSFNFDSGMYEISTASYKSWVVPKYAQPEDGFGQVIPCWSLAALLEQLKAEIQLENKQILFLHINKYDDINHEIRYTNSWTGEVLIAEADNLVDACVDMIEKLHELKLL